MKAMVLPAPGEPLVREERERPVPGPRQVLIKVSACAVCRTDLHILDGDLPPPAGPRIPGHEVVGRVEARGRDATGLALGSRVGVPWLGATCGRCRFCRDGRENLCERPQFTGYTVDGGFAGYTVADERFVLPLPEGGEDASLAPLLCAGLIGYRAWRMAGAAGRLGLYGFGASAHIIIQVARHAGQEVCVFTRPGDRAGQEFARSLGAAWAGGSDEMPPQPLEAAILFAPVGELVPLALEAVDRGGTVVCAGIHMSDIPSFPYARLWNERVIRSVANLTRRDGEEFLALAPTVPVRARVETFPLRDAAAAIARLRAGRIEGAAVLVPEAEDD